MEIETTNATMDNDEVSNILSENEDDKYFIDDSMEIESQQQPSDYFKLRNVKRSISSAEEDAFCKYDIEDFLDSDAEAGNYVSYGMIQVRMMIWKLIVLMGLRKEFKSSKMSS